METAYVKSLSQAFKVVKEFDHESYCLDHRQEMREALKRIIETHGEEYISDWLEYARATGESDRRNGSWKRNLLTEFGNVVIEMKRTRLRSMTQVIEKYARRAKQVDRAILMCFLLGHSTRKVSEALQPILGESFSASTVSRVARILDEHVAAFHIRRLKNRYVALQFDGVHISRKTGVGAKGKPVLVALGITKDRKKEVIDYRLATSESEDEWTIFLNDLSRRGLTGDGVKIITIDGGQGMFKAIGMVFPGIPVQRCWAHKTRNLTNLVRKNDREELKKDLGKISHADTMRDAKKALRKLKDKWGMEYPNVIKSLQQDIDQLLEFFMFDKDSWRRSTRTTNNIERRFKEVRRRTRPMGAFSDRTSLDRILFAVFSHENKNQGIPTLFSLTQNS